MRRKWVGQLTIAAGLLAASVLGVGAAATASSPTPGASGSGIEHIEGGAIDISELTIVGTIDPATGQIEDVEPYHPTPLSQSTQVQQLRLHRPHTPSPILLALGAPTSTA